MFCIQIAFCFPLLQTAVLNACPMDLHQHHLGISQEWNPRLWNYHLPVQWDSVIAAETRPPGGLDTHSGLTTITLSYILKQIGLFKVQVLCEVLPSWAQSLPSIGSAICVLARRKLLRQYLCKAGSDVVYNEEASRMKEGDCWVTAAFIRGIYGLLSSGLTRSSPMRSLFIKGFHLAPRGPEQALEGNFCSDVFTVTDLELNNSFISLVFLFFPRWTV